MEVSAAGLLPEIKRLRMRCGSRHMKLVFLKSYSLGRLALAGASFMPLGGPGTVTEVGPSRGGARYLTVEFLNGTATVLNDNLRLQQFRQPED